MELMILGLALWMLTHFVPTLGRPLKEKLVNSIGENGYKGVFSLMIIFAIYLIVSGWQQALPNHLYTLPPMVRHIAMLGILIAIFLFVSGRLNTRIKQYIRHPQLTGLILWAVMHILINGDSRSVLLFGCLASWAIFEIIFINKRDEHWQKPERPAIKNELLLIVIALSVYIGLVFAHPYIAGVPLR